METADAEGKYNGGKAESAWSTVFLSCLDWIPYQKADRKLLPNRSLAQLNHDGHYFMYIAGLSLPSRAIIIAILDSPAGRD
jgi:hypothetical protein